MLPLEAIGHRTELPSEDQLFSSEGEMVQFVKSFCKQRGYEAIIKGRSSRRTSVYWICNKWKEGCPVKWRAIQKNSSWTIRHSNPFPSHNHPVKSSKASVNTIQLLWCGIPDVHNIAKSDLLGIPFSKSDQEILRDNVLDWLVPEESNEFKTMQQDIGAGFIKTKLVDGPVIHQSVVTLILARRSSAVHVTFRNWTWVKKQLDSNSLLSVLPYTEVGGVRRTLPTVIFVSSTLTQWPDYLSTDDFYKKIGEVADAHGGLRVYPSKTETDRAHRKIGDIRALDMIAETSQYAFSYRPKTCFGIGKCTLVDAAAEKTVLKRGRSCGAADVIITDSSDREKLRCIVPGKPEGRTTVPGGPLWLHQEYVETLQTLGEFRVFIRSRSPSEAIYSQCGEIICVARTRLEWETKAFATRPVDIPNDFKWCFDGGEGGRDEAVRSKFRELCAFALYTYSALRQRHDALECYESLEIGVRLDIGVSELSPKGRFFVNEITRWHAADFFSRLILPYPHIEICQAYADRVVQYFTNAKWTVYA